MSFLSVVILISMYFLLRQQKPLPIYQPNMVNPSLVDNNLQHVKRFHRIQDFSMLNQNGDTIGIEDYRDKIFVTDFFFTTCPSICPIMTDNLLRIQEEFRSDTLIKLLSYSVTPEIDSVAQLKKYSLEKGVDDSKWNLLTGNKEEIYKLARKSYLVVEEAEDPHQMIHTENFVLIDPERRIRGYYDGTDDEEIEQLIKDIRFLKKDYN